jgi:hypothetical protein
MGDCGLDQLIGMVPSFNMELESFSIKYITVYSTGFNVIE